MKLIAARPICAGLDPTGENVLLGFGKGAVFGWHDFIVVGGKVDLFEKEALGQILGNERGTGIASFLCEVKSVEAKVSLACPFRGIECMKLPEWGGLPGESSGPR